MKYITYALIVTLQLINTLYGFDNCPGKKEFFNIILSGEKEVVENDSITETDLVRPKVNYIIKNNKSIFGDNLELIANSENDTIYFLEGRMKFCIPDNDFTPHFNNEYKVYTEPIKVVNSTQFFFYAKNGIQKSIETNCAINRKLRFSTLSSWDGIAGSRNINSYTMYSPDSEKVLSELQYNSYRFIFNYSIAANSDYDVYIYTGLGFGIYFQTQIGFSYNKKPSYRATYTKLLESEDTGLDLPFGLHLNFIYEYSNHYSHMFGAGIGITFQAYLVGK